MIWEYYFSSSISFTLSFACIRVNLKNSWVAWFPLWTQVYSLELIMTFIWIDDLKINNSTDIQHHRWQRPNYALNSYSNYIKYTRIVLQVNKNIAISLTWTS